MSFDAVAGYAPVNQLDARWQHATSIARSAPLSFTSFEAFESGPCTETPPLVDPSQTLWREALTVDDKMNYQDLSANSDGRLCRALSPARYQPHGERQLFSNSDLSSPSDEFDDFGFENQLIADSWGPENIMNYDLYAGTASPAENLKHAQQKNVDACHSSLDRGLDSSNDPNTKSTWAGETCVKKRHHHKALHNVVERRYREHLKHKFEKLENVLSYHQRHTGPSRTRTESQKPMRRPAVLRNACKEIRRMLSDVRDLEQKLKVLHLAVYSDPQTAI